LNVQILYLSDQILFVEASVALRLALFFVLHDVHSPARK
jgi:hypothetical protein